MQGYRTNRQYVIRNLRTAMGVFRNTDLFEKLDYQICSILSEVSKTIFRFEISLLVAEISILEVTL